MTAVPRPVVPDGSGPAPTPGSPRVKICGLTRVEDAAVAAEAGAAYLGAVLSPGFSRSVDPARASAFGAGTGAVRVAVVVDAGVEGSARAARTAVAGVVQLHGEETPEEVAALRGLGPWTIWKALRVRGADEVIRAVERYGEVADALLLDGWHRGRGGGVGVRFPWDVVAGVRDRFPPGLELVAAGGLTPENVAEAVAALCPHVVDVSSGVESAPGIKDPARVRAFVGNAVGARGS